MTDFHSVYLVCLQKVRFEDSFARPMTIRPPMRDADAWTGQPDYDRSLFIRIFCPEGMEESELKCSLSYEGQMFKTPILDGPEEEVMQNPCHVDSFPLKLVVKANLTHGTGAYIEPTLSLLFSCT